MGYLVHLQKFEGPMGLLLYLVRKEEMDIFDIDINSITRQYLDYIRLMKELDLEVAGEFVAMAATLIHIKSRMLLPSYNEEGEIVETEDPRKELVQKLLEYQRYQEAAKKLYDRPLLNRDVWNSSVDFDFTDEEALGEIITEDEGLFSLIASYRKAVKRMKRAVHNVRSKVVSISARVMEIRDRLIVGSRTTLREIVTEVGPSKRGHILITFLSLLELGRMGFVNIFQNETYGDIHIETLKPIEGNVLERVQEFESAGSDDVVGHIINEAMEDRLEAAELAEEAEIRAEVTGESPQLSLGEEALAVPVEMASDEEIFAAELDLSPEELKARPGDDMTAELREELRRDVVQDLSDEDSDKDMDTEFPDEIAGLKSDDGFLGADEATDAEIEAELVEVGDASTDKNGNDSDLI